MCLTESALPLPKPLPLPRSSPPWARRPGLVGALQFDHLAVGDFHAGGLVLDAEGDSLREWTVGCSVVHSVPGRRRPTDYRSPVSGRVARGSQSAIARQLQFQDVAVGRRRLAQGVRLSLCRVSVNGPLSDPGRRSILGRSAVGRRPPHLSGRPARSPTRPALPPNPPAPRRGSAVPQRRMPHCLAVPVPPGLGR